MNILVVCHYGLYKNLSLSFVHNQVREFVALGHNVRVLIPNGIGKIGRKGKRFDCALSVSTVDDVELYDLRYFTASTLGENGFNTQSAIISIKCNWKKIFEGFTPDVIHAHTLGFDSNIGAWLKQKFNCKLVVTTHGGDTFTLFDKGKLTKIKSYANKADAVICVSDLLKRHLVKCNVCSDMYVILNGFNIKYSKHSGIKKAYSVIQVGNLIPRKKTDITIIAVSQLLNKYPNIHLTVVGSGPELANLKNLVSRLGIEANVSFKGQLDNDNVHALLSDSAIFVMPSIREGFGIVYLEAMAAGCITIGTKGEGIDGVIRNGENGFLVDADTPEAISCTIDSCFTDKENSRQISLNGMQTAENLTWMHNAIKTVQIYKSYTSRG